MPGLRQDLRHPTVRHDPNTSKCRRAGKWKDLEPCKGGKVLIWETLRDLSIFVYIYICMRDRYVYI